MSMDMRDALLAKIQAQYDADPAPPPVVTLDDYFTLTGNVRVRESSHQRPTDRSWAESSHGPVEGAASGNLSA